MKKYLLRLDLEWEIEAPDNLTEESEVLDILADQIVYSNESVENIFWEGMQVCEKKDKVADDE